MTEVTRVPLQPIARGSLLKLWLGVLLALLVGAGIAWAARVQGVEVETLTAGTGPSPAADSLVQINYVGKLENGKVFDRGNRVPMDLTTTIPGFRDGIVKMQKGGRYRLTIPADKAYGAEERRDPQTGEVVIPGNSDLVFEVDLLDFLSREEVMRRQQMMQQLQQLQGMQGAPGGAGAPLPPPQ